MTGDLRTRVEALAARIKREAQLLGGCHPIDKGARRNIGIDADRLAALALDADPDAPAADNDPADYGYEDLPRRGPHGIRVIPNTPPEEMLCRTCGRPATEHAPGQFSIYGVCPPTADAPADTDLRMDMREAIYYCLTDASMWIGDDGQPLDYLPAREALMGEFLDEVVDALLPPVRAQMAEAWEQGRAAERRDWEFTFDLSTPDEDRQPLPNPYRAALSGGDAT